MKNYFLTPLQNESGLIQIIRMGKSIRNKWVNTKAYSCYELPKRILQNSRCFKNRCLHYANMPVQYTAIFHGCKNRNFQIKKNVIFFLFFIRYIDRGYTLEPPHLGGSNEYPQSMF